MRNFSLTAVLLLSLVEGCGRQDVTLAQSIGIADRRYMAYAKVLGIQSSEIPKPEIELREGDTVFVYAEPTSKKKVIVIVDKSGTYADGVESFEK